MIRGSETAKSVEIGRQKKSSKTENWLIVEYESKMHLPMLFNVDDSLFMCMFAYVRGRGQDTFAYMKGQGMRLFCYFCDFFTCLFMYFFACVRGRA